VLFKIVQTVLFKIV